MTPTTILSLVLAGIGGLLLLFSKNSKFNSLVRDIKLNKDDRAIDNSIAEKLAQLKVEEEKRTLPPIEKKDDDAKTLADFFNNHKSDS